MFELTQTIEHGNLKVDVTVRAESGFDTYVEKILFTRLYQIVMGRDYQSADWWTPETQAVNELVPVINRTVVASGIPISWPNYKSDDKALCAAWEYLQQIPAPVWEAWAKLVKKANEPPGDSDLFPPEALPDSKKKTQP
jgi:hypothetical protein